jgi:hypothetical protein
MKTIPLRLLWLSVPVLCLCALYSTGLRAYISYLGLRYDLIAVHNAVDEHPEAFSNVQLHHRPPRQSVGTMIEEHDFLAGAICVMFGVLIFLIAYLTVTLILCMTSRRTNDNKASAQSEQNMPLQSTPLSRRL